MSLTAAELRAVYSVDEGELDKSIKGLPGKIKASAAMLAGAGLVIGGALGAGLLGGMENERVNDQLAAQLGLTAPESQRIGALAGQLYADAYGDSLSGVNTAVSAVITSIGGMREASSADIKAVTADALNFATAFEVDVARSTQVAGQLLRNGLAKDAGEAFDLLTAASQKVPAAVRGDVLDAVDEYGQFFNALGYDGPAAFGLLVKGAEQGMYGIDKAGDALKEFTIRSTDMSTASKDAYKAVGLNAQDMANKILAGGETAQAATQKIITGILGIEDPAKRANTAIALFGTPIEDLGTSKIPDFLKSLQGGTGALGDFSGAADRMGDTLNNNAATNLESFKRQAMTAFVDIIGGKALPFVTSIASTLATQFGPAVSAVGGFISGTLVPALSSMATWMGENETAIQIVAGLITAVFLPHLAALGVASLINGAKVVIGWVMTSAGAVAAAIAHSVAVVGMVAGWVLMGAQSLIQAAKVAAAWFIAMGPVGWVIGIVVGLVALIIANWDKVKSWTISAWNAVTSFVSGAWRNISSAVSSGVSTAVEWVRGLPGRILGALGNLGGLLLNAGSDMVMGFIRGIGNMAQRAANAAIDVARRAVNGLKSFLGISSPSKVFAGLGQNVGQGFVNGIAGMRPAVAAEMMRLANVQALNSLTVRRPGGMLLPATDARTAADSGTSTAGDRGPLFHADTVNVVEGTPVDVARQLELGARTRGHW